MRRRLDRVSAVSRGPLQPCDDPDPAYRALLPARAIRVQILPIDRLAKRGTDRSVKVERSNRIDSHVGLVRDNSRTNSKDVRVLRWLHTRALSGIRAQRVAVCRTCSPVTNAPDAIFRMHSDRG